MIGPLIPVPKGKKGTHLNNWSTLSPEALAQEVSKNNGGNLGLRLDHYASIDPDSPAARSLVDQWEKDGKIPPTVSWRTASGAIRRLFKAPPGLQRMQVADLKLDLRHGTGFFDIIPPSYVVDLKKGIDGYYQWLPDQGPGDIEPADLPVFVIDFFKSNSLDSSNSSILYNCKPNATNSPWLKLWEGVDDGGRNNASTSLAGRLLARGIMEDEVIEILTMWNQRNRPPLPQNTLIRNIQGIEKKDLRKHMGEDRKIAEEVRDWVLTTSDPTKTTGSHAGTFLTTDIYRDLQLTTKDHKKAAIMALLRLRDEGVVVECGTKRGCYRTIEHESPVIEWEDADIDSIYDLKWPFGLETLVNIYPKNIIIVAGAPNAGKTAFLLNLVRMNMGTHKIHFLCSEMGPEEIKLRISKFGDEASVWKKFKPRSRAFNFADAIRPNVVNIIDYFEIGDNFYGIGEELRKIFDKLEKGIAVVAIQKKVGQDLGRGAEFSLEKPRLYLSMDGGKLKIVKGKNWAKPGLNPNGMEIKFKLIGGAEFLEYE